MSVANDSETKVLTAAGPVTATDILLEPGDAMESTDGYHLFVGIPPNVLGIMLSSKPVMIHPHRGTRVSGSIVSTQHKDVFDALRDRFTPPVESTGF